MSTENENKTERNDSQNARPRCILPFEKSGEYTVEPLGTLKKKPFFSFVKRLFDIVGSLCALLLLALPMCVIAAVVRFSSRGSVIYRQERLGKNGRSYMILKYRTMHPEAEAAGAQWTLSEDDERVTPVGRFLRRTRLDELPQLFCILAGSMSFVGPRPERSVFYDEFETYIHGFRERLAVTPGLTGFAQINGYDMRPEEKIMYDMWYIRNRSLLLDLKILFRTVAVVLRREKKEK